MKKLLQILLLLPLVTFSQWNPLGVPINGEAAIDYSGATTDLSADGTVLAVGASYNNGNGVESGHVRIFKNISGTWTQIGQDIDGEAVNDLSGAGLNFETQEDKAISLNSDGSIIVIGAGYNDGNGTDSGHVRVYQNISGTWVQVGSDIDGASANEHFGLSVDINADGTIIAAGAPTAFSSGSPSGFARVYELISGNWVQRGTDIIGEASGDYFGASVSLNSNGNVLAVGAQYNDGTAGNAGQVRVYSYSTGQNKNSSNNRLSGSWAQLGSDIDGEGQNDLSGCSVSLDATGNIVAIGAKWNTAGGLGVTSGQVRVFERISGVWTQVGSDIDSSVAQDQFGFCVDISSDGTRVISGAQYNDGNGNESGQVRVFDNISGVWTQVYSDIYGVVAGDHFGASVTISGDGGIIASGAPWNSTSSNNSGQVRVFQDPTFLGVLENELEGKISLFPNPSNNYFEIESNETLSKVEVYSLLGQSIKNFTPQNKYDISDLSSGVYYIKIKVNTGEITKRIVKE